MSEENIMTKQSVGWLEMVNYTDDPVPGGDSTRRGLAFINGSLYYWDGSDFVALSVGGGGISTWDSLYDLDKTLNIDDDTLRFALTAASGDGITITASGVSTGNALVISNAGSGYDVYGTSGLWKVTKTGVATFASLTAASLTAPSNLAIDATGSGTITIAGTSTGAITLGANVAIAASKTLTLTGADGSSILTMTAGDAVLSDGSLAITDTDNASSFTLTNNTISTGTLAVMTANAVTSGTMLSLVTTAAGFSGGYFFTCNDGSIRFSVGVDGATTIATGVNSTKALEITGIQTGENLVTLTSSGATADDKAIILINSSGNSASGSNQIRIAPSGTPVEGSIGIEFVGASKVMQAMKIDGDSVNNSVVLINGGGALASTKAVLEVTADGAIAAGGTVARFAFSGTDTNTPSVVYATTSGAGAVFEGVNTNAGALGAWIKLYHNSASPANNDVIGRVTFSSKDAGANVEVMARMDAVVTDTTAASADADLMFYVIRNNTLTLTLKLDSDVNGVVVGDAAAAAKIASNGDYDLILQTGNATTGNITLTDGANGNITIAPNGSGKVDLANAVLMSKTQALSGAGAVDVVSSITEITTTGTDALTLADGTEGQIKFCVMVADGGDGTLTPSHPGDFSTIKFTDVGNSCTLMFTNGKWYILANNGCTVS